MHEFSISSEIVKTVLDTAEKNHGKKVLSIQLEIGELTLLNGEQVVFWVHELFKGSVAEGAEVRLKTIKAQISCNACGYHGRPLSNQEDFVKHITQYSCPRCGSFQIKIERGQGCVLKRIQAVRND